MTGDGDAPLPPPVARRGPRRTDGDAVRSWLSVGVGAVALVPLAGVVVLSDETFPPLLFSFVLYDVAALAYVVLTWRAFAPLPPAELAERVLANPDRGGSLWRTLNGGTSGLGFSVQTAVVALGASALLPRVSGVVPADDRLAVTVLVVAAVVLAWVSVAVSYAVAYARADLAQGGLEFPGGRAPRFHDYAYLSVAVSTTFGTTDVTVTTTPLRRLVCGQGLIAFAFNTVIVALLVAALVG